MEFMGAFCVRTFLLSIVKISCYIKGVVKIELVLDFTSFGSQSIRALINKDSCIIVPGTKNRYNL